MIILSCLFYRELNATETLHANVSGGGGEGSSVADIGSHNNGIGNGTSDGGDGGGEGGDVTKIKQIYNYLICIDFEATCWENQAPPQWRSSEIIEFPAVLVNMKTGKVEAEFHKYIRPIEIPKLSEFCRNLTGIDQATVDNGIPLQAALNMFDEWLKKELQSRNLYLPETCRRNLFGNCAFVTWTDWDLGTCLHKECARKGIQKPPYFKRWINLKLICKNKYSSLRRHFRFSEALEIAGLQFVGREHSGIDDAKNLAALSYKLATNGTILKITTDLNKYNLKNRY